MSDSDKSPLILPLPDDHHTERPSLPENLTALFYVLARDHVPVGDMEDAMRTVMRLADDDTGVNGVAMTIPELEMWARRQAARIMGPWR